MQSRVAVSLLVVGVVGVAALISCRDVAPPQPSASVQNDDWAEAALITLPPLLKYEEHDRITRHFRGRDGTVYSVVAVGDARGGPPNKIFAFENGKIRYVVKPMYKRHGAGWARARSTVTEYDSTGHRVRDAESDAQPPAGATLAHSANSATLTPADALPQNFTDMAGCVTQWFAYALASATLAAASAALAAAVSECAINPAACFTVQSASSAFLAALATWSAALDRLVACETGGGGGMTGGRKVLKYDGTTEEIDPAFLTTIDAFLVEEAL